MQSIKASKQLTNEIEGQLKFFERGVDNWADVVKVLAKINETLQQYPAGTKMMCFTEFMQRIGQCVGRKPELPQGVHLNVLAIYHSLIVLLDQDLPLYLDILFVPLLPLYSFATISTKKAFLALIKDLLAKNIDKKYIGPIVAALLSTQPSDPEEVHTIKGLLEQFETSYGEFYIASLFRLLQHPCEARKNVLQTIHQLLKKYFEQQWQLDPFDGHEQYLNAVLESDKDDELRLVLDIIQILYPVPNVFTPEIFEMFQTMVQKSLLLLQKDQTIASRVESWMFSALAETYSRLLLHALLQLFGHCQSRLNVVKSLFIELARREEILDSFLAAFPVLVNEVFQEIPADQLKAFLDKEDFVKVYIYRSIAMQIMGGSISIHVGEADANIDCMKQTNLAAVRQDLSLENKLQLVQSLLNIAPVLPTLTGMKAFATQHEDTVDVFGGIIYRTEEQASVVVAELIAIVLDLYIETYSEQCLDLALELFKKVDLSVAARVLVSEHEDANDILKLLKRPVYEKLATELQRNDRLVLNQKLMRIMQLIVQNSQIQVHKQKWLWRAFFCCLGQSVDVQPYQTFEAAVQAQYNAPVVYSLEERQNCLDLFLALISEHSSVQNQVEYFVEHQTAFTDVFVMNLFTQITELTIEPAEWLCRFCSINNLYFLQKLETLIAQNIYDKSQQHQTIVRFIALWQTSAEKFPQFKLFKRLTLLSIDMFNRPDVLEETRLVLGAFIRRVFHITEWAAELLDNLVDQLGGWPEILRTNDRFRLKKKTDSAFQCDVNKIAYIFGLLNMLVHVNKDYFIMSVVDAPLSKHAKEMVIQLPFYPTEYRATSYLDLLLDFAMCFVVVDDQLPQKLVSSVTEFMQQILLVLKQTLNRMQTLVNMTIQVSDRISPVLLKTMLTVANDNSAQQVFLSVLDTAAHMVLIGKDIGQQTMLNGNELVQIPQIFTNLLKNDFLATFLQTLKNKKSYTLGFVQQTLDILSTLKVDFSEADTNSYVRSWGFEGDETKIQNISTKQLPSEILAQIQFDGVFGELEKRADQMANRIRSLTKTELARSSFMPARYRFHPVCFLSILTIETLGDVLGREQNISLDFAYSVAQLVLKCAQVLSSQVQQTFQLISYDSVCVGSEKISLEAAFDKKKIEYKADELGEDRQNSFVLPMLLKLIHALFDKTELNTRSISLQTLALLQQSLQILGAYNPVLFGLTLSMLYKQEASFGAAACIAGALSAADLLRSACCLNFFRQKQADLSHIKTLQTAQQLYLGCSASYSALSQFLTVAGQCADASLMAPALFKAAIGLEDPLRTLIALIQFCHSKFQTYTHNFKTLLPNDQFVTPEQMQSIGIESLAQVMCCMQSAITAENFKAVAEEDRQTIRRFATRVLQALFALVDATQQIPREVVEMCFESVFSLAQTFCGDIVKPYCTEQVARNLGLLKDLKIAVALRPKPLVAEMCNADLTHFAVIIPHLLQYTFKNPNLKSRAFQILNLFSRLELGVQKKLFQKPVFMMLKEIMKNEPADICAVGSIIGAGASDLAETFQTLNLKKPEQKSIIRSLVLMFGQDQADFDLLEQQICQQARQPDDGFFLVVMHLNAVLISQPHELIKDHWTNIVEFITAGNQAKVKDLDVTCYLLGMKCPDKQLYVGFLPQKQVENPKAWLTRKLVELWTYVQ